MQRRKQGPKEETQQTSEETPAITFAFLAVSLTGAKGTKKIAQLATTARSSFEQQELWKLAERLFQREMGSMGRILKVDGDLQSASYMILAPRVQLLPGVLLAAKQFMTECASVKTLQLQLQIGRSAVVDYSGRKRSLQLHSCCAKCQGCAAGFGVAGPLRQNLLLLQACGLLHPAPSSKHNGDSTTMAQHVLNYSLATYPSMQQCML